MTTHILIHGQEDTVGVVVVENIEAGMELTGWVMDSDETISVEARDPIPLGHKVALRRIEEGEKIKKFGVPVGTATKMIEPGQHVHMHNVVSNHITNDKDYYE